MSRIDATKVAVGGLWFWRGQPGIGAVVIALIGGAILGINPLTILGLLSGEPAPQVRQAPAHRPPAEDKTARFVSTVLADTDDVWTDAFKQGGASYRAAQAGAVPGHRVGDECRRPDRQ
jgi:predicted metalloprotease